MRLPPLRPRKVVKILEKIGFKEMRQTGSHLQKFGKRICHLILKADEPATQKKKQPSPAIGGARFSSFRKDGKNCLFHGFFQGLARSEFGNFH